MYSSHKVRKIVRLVFVCGIIGTFILSMTIGFNGVTNTSKELKEDVEVIQLVTVIVSAVANFERRQTIRQTWLSEIVNSKIVKYYFVIGTDGLSVSENGQLIIERKNYSDLLLLDNVPDAYENLTRKILESFKWVHNHDKFEYLLKVDDDSFVILSRLIHELNRLPSSRLYLGFFDGRASVKRKGQWAEHNWSLCDRYLPYACGGGYALSSDLVAFIATNADLLQCFNSEDVSVGAWLAGLDIKRQHDPRFDTEYRSRGCNNAFMVTHKQTIADMFEKWRNLQKSGVICEKESRTRLSYVYNWNVLPSNCCHRNDSSVP